MFLFLSNPQPIAVILHSTNSLRKLCAIHGAQRYIIACSQESATGLCPEPWKSIPHTICLYKACFVTFIQASERVSSLKILRLKFCMNFPSSLYMSHVPPALSSLTWLNALVTFGYEHNSKPPFCTISSSLLPLLFPTPRCSEDVLTATFCCEELTSCLPRLEAVAVRACAIPRQRWDPLTWPWFDYLQNIT
jgi:hypothetical protein